MKKNRKFTVVHGKRRGRTGEKLTYFLLAAVIIVFGIQALYSFARDALTARFVRTVVVENGVLETLQPVAGVIVREERVVAAPSTGKLEWLVDEGERLAIGTPVARIKTGENSWQTVHTSASGVIIMQLDGLEGVLQPRSLTKINVPLIQKLPLQPSRLSAGEEVTQGSLLFKIVDNFTWYYAVELSVGEYAGLSEQSSVTLRFSFAPDQDATGQPVVVEEGEDKVILIFEMKDDVDGCFTERLASADVITKRTLGIVLPASALIERGDETGVYILDKSVVRYRPVDVMDAWQGEAVVSGLRIGFPVITNPSLVREGQRL
jgi:putative membrane fusion protein